MVRPGFGQAHMFADFNDIIDVIVEIELARRQGHHARIDPVGDVDVMRLQELLDRAAQQRGVMARHRRHDDKARLLRRIGRQVALEMQEMAERLVPHHLFGHLDLDPIHESLVEAKGRLAIAAGHPLEQFGRSGEIFAERRVGERIGRVLESQPREIGKRAGGGHGQLSHLKEMIRVTVHFGLHYPTAAAMRRRFTDISRACPALNGTS